MRGSTMTEMTTTMLPLTGQSIHCNVTECMCQKHSSVDGVIYIINQLICLFGLAGNGIILWFLTSNLRKNPFIIYIFNLAVADFAFLLCCLTVICIFTVEYFGSYHFCQYMVMSTLYKMEILLYSTSMSFLTVISSERCLCALFPIWYRSHCPKSSSASVSAFLWFLTIVLSGVSISSCSIRTHMCKTMVKVIAVINFSIIAPLMIMSSLTLFIKVRYCLRQRSAGHLYSVVLFTVLCFIIFAIPLSVQLFLKELGYSKLPKIFYLFASVNSSINPVIYFLIGRKKKKGFREPLRYILNRALNEEKSSGGWKEESMKQISR